MMKNTEVGEKLRESIYRAKLMAYTTQSTDPVKHEKIERLQKKMDAVQRIVDDILDE